MMINKFVNDFIKLLKYENLFIKRIIDFSDEKNISTLSTIKNIAEIFIFAFLINPMNQ